MPIRDATGKLDNDRLNESMLDCEQVVFSSCAELDPFENIQE